MIPIETLLGFMKEQFPHAHCELQHQNAFELLIAVTLSAQTTDASVNKVTPALFAAYPTPYALAHAKPSDVEAKLRNLGLYRNKAKNIVMLANQLVDHFQGEVPFKMEELTSLAGVGRKTASVVRSVWFDIPSVPVDTHVERVSKRLKIAKEADSVLQVEAKFKRKVPRSEWNQAHHLFIFFGRYFCTARNPKCDGCPFRVDCRYYTQHHR
ncbi:MAG: endonuclease III [Erysipelotrichaceae bacterium]